MWAASLGAPRTRRVPSVIVASIPAAASVCWAATKVGDADDERAGADGSEDVADRADRDAPAGVHDGQTVAGLLDLVEKVTRNDNGAAR